MAFLTEIHVRFHSKMSFLCFKRCLCNFTFQVTVAYSMHTGYLDKAVKYTEKALAQIEKIRGMFILESIWGFLL